jgi:hypothetical protein
MIIRALGVFMLLWIGCNTPASDCADDDDDGDGFPGPNATNTCCGDFCTATDCNDQDPAIHPNRVDPNTGQLVNPVSDPENDGIDWNCDGVD